MRKIITFITSISLALSIMSPALVMLSPNPNQELEIVIDFGEEEQKNELEEKNTFFEYITDYNYTIIEDQLNRQFVYLVREYPSAQEIVLPPPEYHI